MVGGVCLIRALSLSLSQIKTIAFSFEDFTKPHCFCFAVFFFFFFFFPFGLPKKFRITKENLLFE